MVSFAKPLSNAAFLPAYKWRASQHSRLGFVADDIGSMGGHPVTFIQCVYQQPKSSVGKSTNSVGFGVDLRLEKVAHTSDSLDIEVSSMGMTQSWGPHDSLRVTVSLPLASDNSHIQATQSRRP